MTADSQVHGVHLFPSSFHLFTTSFHLFLSSVRLFTSSFNVTIVIYVNCYSLKRTKTIARYDYYPLYKLLPLQTIPRYDYYPLRTIARYDYYHLRIITLFTNYNKLFLMREMTLLPPLEEKTRRESCVLVNVDVSRFLLS